MLVAVALLGARPLEEPGPQAGCGNPMLTGVVVWAVAHLLVNGDVGLAGALRLAWGSGRWPTSC